MVFSGIIQAAILYKTIEDFAKKILKSFCIENKKYKFTAISRDFSIFCNQL